MKLFRKILLFIVLLGGVFYCIAQWNDWFSSRPSGPWCTLLISNDSVANNFEMLAYVDTIIIDTTGRYEAVYVADSSYYIDYPNVRLIMLKTHHLWHIGDYTINQTWLNRSLMTAGDRWKIVCMHRSVYSATMMHTHAMIYGAFRLTLNKADLVISGEDYSYARRADKTIDKSLKTPVFLVSNASYNYNIPKLKKADQCVASMRSFFQTVSATSDSLSVRSHLINDSVRIPYVYAFVPDSLMIDSVITRLALTDDQSTIDSIMFAMSYTCDSARYSSVYDAFSIAHDTHILHNIHNLPEEIIEFPELYQSDTLQSSVIDRFNSLLYSSKTTRSSYRRQDRLKK